MALIATELRRQSDWLKHEYEPSVGYCREGVVLNEATTRVLVGGTVLGQVTANGKYKVSAPAAVDGSQTPVAVLYEDSISLTAGVDARAVVMVRGPIQVLKTGLTFDTTINTAPLIATAQAALVTKGIQMIETM
jgi:hypothetical protein